MPMRDAIRILHLPIGYTASLDFAIGDQLLPDPIEVLDLRDSDRTPYEEKLILPPGNTPFLNSPLQYPRVIRKLLVEEYLQRYHGSK
jgi:hypothetical protein